MNLSRRPVGRGAPVALALIAALLVAAVVRTDRPESDLGVRADDVTVTGIYGPDPVANSFVLRLPPASNREPPRPLVVFVHGGGFILRPPGALEPGILRALSADGWAVAEVLYRLAPQHTAPAALEDVALAIRWFKAHAPQLGLDPDRIVLAGHSAGGLLSLVTGLSCRIDGGAPSCAESLQPPRVPREIEAVDSTVAAIISIAPVVDLASWATMSDNARLVTGMLLGCAPVPACNVATANQLSPRRWIDPSDPPLMIVYGTSDDAVDASLNAGPLIDEAIALTSRKDSRLLVVDGADHSTILGIDGTPLLDFLEDVGA